MFHPFFREGGQLTPFAPTCGRPWPSIMMSSVVMTDMSKYGASDGLVVFYSEANRHVSARDLY